jgi:hypothetical protein
LQILGQAGLLARARGEDLRFDYSRGRGVVFHMLSSVEPLATVGLLAIADTPHEADELYVHAHEVVAHAGRKRAAADGAVSFRAALGTQG